LFSTEISFEDNPVENVLINCAGIREILSIEELTLSIWDEVFKTNVTAPFVASKAFCSALINHGLSGSIINIASTSGVLGEPHRTAYVASKHAVIGLTKQLAIEYGEFDIRVNAIAPGIIRTPMTEHYFNTEKQRQAVEQGQFIKHTGLPMDVAGAAMYLASNKARFLTGTTIVMDGGWTAGKRL